MDRKRSPSPDISIEFELQGSEICRWAPSVDATVEPGEIKGPAFLVKRLPHGLYGYALGRNVFIDWTNEKVLGFVGTSPVNVSISQENGGWRARGLYAGRLMDLWTDSARIEGSAGECGYSLRAVTPTYFEGFRACPRHIEPTSMVVPALLGRSSESEYLASLALLMSL